MNHRMPKSYPPNQLVVYTRDTMGQEGYTSAGTITGAAVAASNLAEALALHFPGGVDFVVPHARAAMIEKSVGNVFRKKDKGNRIEQVFVHSTWELPKLLSQKKHVAFHNPESIDLSLLNYARSRFAKIPIPITCTQYAFSYQEMLFNTFASMLLSSPLACDSIFCATEAARTALSRILNHLREDLKHMGVELSEMIRLDVLPYGIDTDFFKPHDRKAARHFFDFPDESTLLLWFGRFSPVSKADLNPLLIAFQALKEKSQSKLLLVLAASDDYSGFGEIWKKNAQELGLHPHVRVLSNVPAAIRPLLYSAADIFVSPVDNPQENFGITPLEAMSCGCPVVVSDWNGYRQTVIHAQTGFRVSTYWIKCDEKFCDFAPLTPWNDDHLYLAQTIVMDVVELISYLQALVSNKDLRERMGRMAREHVVADYDWRVVIKQYWTIWKELYAIAQSLSNSRMPYLEYLRPRYFQDFSVYASEVLTDEAVISLAPRGHKSLSGHQPLQIYYQLRCLIRPEVVMETLRIVDERGSMSLGQITSALVQQTDLYQEEAKVHLMWMLKQDFLRLKRS